MIPAAETPSCAARTRPRWVRVARVLLVGWLVASVVAPYYVLHPVTRPVRDGRVPEGCACESVGFTSSDGAELQGWLLSPEPGREFVPRSVVILCHGAFENRLGVIDCAPKLLGSGFEVLSFDFRARGRSGGDRSTIGWRETDDVLAAVELVRRRRPGAQIGLMGFSMGAAAALMAAASDPGVRAVVADSAYDRLDRGLDRHLRTIFQFAAPVLGAPARALIVRGLGVDPTTVSPLAEAPKLAGRPVLLIHGSSDFMTDPAGSERIEAAIGPGAALWLAPGARHTKARKRLPQDYWSRVGEFWQHVFCPAEGGEGMN